MTLNLSDMLNSERIEKKPKEMSILELKNEIKKFKAEHIDTYPLLTEIHKKIAIAFSSLVFVLIGIPLAIVSRRSERSVGFGISLVIIVGYYLLFAAGEAFSKRGSLSPVVGIWAADTLLLVVGIILTTKMAKR